MPDYDWGIWGQKALVSRLGFTFLLHEVCEYYPALAADGLFVE